MTRARRHGAHRPRGDRGAPDRAPDRPHAGRLPGGDRVRLRACPRGRPAARTKLAVQLFHGGREQIATAPRPPAVAPSRSRASASRSSRAASRRGDRGDHRRVRAGGEARGQGDPRRTSDLSRARGYLIAQFFTPELNQGGRLGGTGSLPARGAGRSSRVGRPRSRSGSTLGRLPRCAGDPQPAWPVGPTSSTWRSETRRPTSARPGSCRRRPPSRTRHGVDRGVPGRPPLIATSRIVDPEEADRLLGEGRADAVGMTRALITDPDLPQKAREGDLEKVVRCIACNACIAHYHAATAIACAQNPRTGRELSAAALGAGRAAGPRRGRRRRAHRRRGGRRGGRGPARRRPPGTRAEARRPGRARGRCAGPRRAHLRAWLRNAGSC